MSGKPPETLGDFPNNEQPDTDSPVAKALAASFEAEAEGDDPGDENDASQQTTEESAQSEETDPAAAHLEAIRKMLAGGEPEPKAESKPESKPETAKEQAKAVGEDVADDLAELFTDQFGEELGAKMAASVGKHVEKIVAGKLGEFAGNLKPLVDHYNGEMLSKADRALQDYTNDAIGELGKGNAIFEDAYGRTPSEANAEQIKLRAEVRETAKQLGAAMAKRGIDLKGKDKDILRDAELLVRTEWLKKQGGAVSQSKTAVRHMPGTFKKQASGGVAAKVGGSSVEAALAKFAHK